jgi:hypothetical protein
VFLKVCGVGRRGRHSELKALANGDVTDNPRMRGVEGAQVCMAAHGLTRGHCG